MPQLIRLISDTHNEFVPAPSSYGDLQMEHIKFILPKTKTDKDSTLILAGDIFSFLKPGSYTNLIDYVKDNFQHVVYIAGNHEFYGGDYSNADNEFRKFIAPISNFHYLDSKTNFSVVIDDIVIIGTTLWTDFYKNDDAAKVEIGKFMNDYFYIKNNGKYITVDDVYEWHMNELYSIIEEFKKYDNTNYKKVVVTHHGPSYHSIHPRYNDAGLSNYGFTSDLEYLMERYRPKLWVHGHTHMSLDYTVADTRVVTNPVGYRRGFQLQYENRDFEKKLILSV